ncbi:right-handed parallel beta-helix repeat-containing protein [Tenacibaculum halocynthiae]|uniref:right-handed parallel beta-helix repeat-containing protein n=1 Tax=Tenacibaculum halocynthiae TaxID=1254437 RepID=UPI00389320EA
MKKNYLFLFFVVLLSFQTSYATKYFVNLKASGTNDGSSWTNAFTSLSTALANASSGDEIWVAKGTYKPSKDGFIILSGVRLYGGFSGNENTLNERNLTNFETILDGNIGDLSKSTDNATHVVYMKNVSNQTRLDGFKIINGHSNNLSNDSKGGGLYNLGGRPTIANCFFSDNFSENYGGGICSESGYIKIENCTITNNTVEGFGAGIHLSQRGTATISNSKISLNKSIYGSGGAISSGNGFSSLTIDRTEISGNTVQDFAGAIVVGDDTSVTIYNSLILGNTAKKGIISMHTTFNSETHKIINTTFSGNKSTEKSSRSCTLIFNDNTKVANCIFWDNLAPAGNIYKFKTLVDPLVSNCIIENGHDSGTDNITTDPKFKNPASKDDAPFSSDGYDFSLDSKSPGINTGNNSYLSSKYNLDINEFERNFDSHIVDIGCYEYQATLSIKNNTLLNTVSYYNYNTKSIIINTSNISKIKYQLFDLKGLLVAKGTTLGKSEVSINNLNNGIYILKLKDFNSNSIVSKKLIKY